MTQSDIQILLVEDNEADARLLQEIFIDVGKDFLYQITHVNELKKALKKLKEKSYDVILLDLTLPDSHGLNTLIQLQLESSQTPVIVLTGDTDESASLKALEMGAHDYLVKMNVDSELLKRSIRYARERHQTQNRINYLSHHDVLTDLPNRSLLNERMNHFLDKANRFEKMMGVITIDINRFKIINDTLGHEVGDQLLQLTAQRLSMCISTDDTIARVGGDEFTIILDCMNDEHDAELIAQKIIKEINKPFQINDTELFITASIGISSYPNDGTESKSLIKKADIAVHKAKGKGRNNYQIYRMIMETPSLERLALENSLRKALENDEFFVYYQPIVDVLNKRILAMEALVRWNHPDFGIIGPKKFIPIAEEIGIIIPLGEWVLRQACQQNIIWQKMNFVPIQISVNFSAHQFEQKDIADKIKNILTETEMSHSYLNIEITESTLIKDIDHTQSILEDLKKLGVHISIDDFGTGYSSLSYLKRFPIESLKIDQSFIHDIVSNSEDRSITKAIIAMAHSLNMEIVAEGVESNDQLEILRALETEKIQGYFSGQPLPPHEATKLLEEENHMFKIAKFI